jgi:hypothetical protein
MALVFDEDMKKHELIKLKRKYNTEIPYKVRIDSNKLKRDK